MPRPCSMPAAGRGPLGETRLASPPVLGIGDDHLLVLGGPVEVGPQLNPIILVEMKSALERRMSAVWAERFLQRHADEVLIDLPHIDDKAGQPHLADSLIERVAGQDQSASRSAGTRPVSDSLARTFIAISKSAKLSAPSHIQFYLDGVTLGMGLVAVRRYGRWGRAAGSRSSVGFRAAASSG